MADDDLSELFPQLQQVLNQWGQPAPANPAGNGNGNVDIADHGGVTDEDINSYIESRGGVVGPNPAVSGQGQRPPEFQPGQSAPPPPPSHVEDAVPPQPSPQPEETPPAPQPEENLEDIQIGDRRIPRQRVEAYESFDQLVRSDPRLQGLLDSYLRTGHIPPELVGAGQPVQSPAAPTEPASTPPVPRPEPPPVDLEDPSVRYLYEQQQQIQGQIEERLANLQQGLQRTTNFQEVQAQQQQQAIINRATASFQQQYGLTEEDMQRVHDTTVRLNVLPSLLSGIDPMTGAPTRPDPLAAVERSFEIAYYNMPEFRNRAFRGWVEQQVKDHERRSKLGALSGSSGSVPRTQPAPANDQQRQDALRREVSEMFAGTWSAPE